MEEMLRNSANTLGKFYSFQMLGIYICVNGGIVVRRCRMPQSPVESSRPCHT